MHKYLKLSKKLPEAHHLLTRTDVTTCVAQKFEGGDAVKQASCSDMSKAILSNLTQQLHPTATSENVLRQITPNRCELQSGGGPRHHKRRPKPQVKLSQSKPSGKDRKRKASHTLAFSADVFWQRRVLSSSMAAKFPKFAHPRRPEGKGRD